METLTFIIKYGFLVVFAVEAILVGRSLLQVVIEKSRPNSPEAPAPQE